MQKTNDRKGFAVAALVSLLASLFAVAPSATADESGVVLEPATGTSNVMLITEPFNLKSRLGSSVDSDRISFLRYQIDKPAGYVISYSMTVGTISVTDKTQLTSTASAVSATATTSGELNPSNESTTSMNVLTIQPWSASAALTSESPAVNVTVTAYLDLDNSGDLSPSDPREVEVINFVKWSVFAPTVTLPALVVGGTKVTASSDVTGTLNYQQLNGQFELVTKSTNDNGTTTSASVSGTAVGAASDRMSVSTTISAGVKDQSISATVYYKTASYSEILGQAKSAIGARSINGITFSAVVGSNLKRTNATSAEARTNAAFGFQVWTYTNSSTIATVVAAAPVMTVAITNASLSNNEYVVIEGVQYTSSADLPTVSGVTLAAGKSTVDVSTFGFSGNEVMTFTFANQNRTATYTVDVNAATYTLEEGDATVNVKPGVTPVLAWDIEDQFSVKSPLTNQRVTMYVVGSGAFSESASVSFDVVNGAVSGGVAPSPATATGSATLKATLQTKDLASGLWSNGETEDITVVVSSLENGFTTSNIVSVSASISYAVASDLYSWSATAMSGTTVLGGTDVVVSGANLLFKDGTKTASGTITVRSDANGAFSFNVASEKAGTHVVTLTVGSVSTTSTVTISAAAHDSGKTITFAQTEIYAGETATIVGVLTDANGNPVATGNTASVAVTWTGKGLPFNFSSAMQTDADGEFSFNVLVLSSETGDAAVSATYKPAGAAVSTANITKVHAFDVVAEKPVAASDAKITVGTFKGYVAIYTKGYMGQKLSAKVAGKWLVVDPIAAYKSNDYSRAVRLTGAGYTITVDLYIDGVFVRSEVVTTK
jgi:hypothetical protein